MAFYLSSTPPSQSHCIHSFPPNPQHPLFSSSPFGFSLLSSPPPKSPLPLQPPKISLQTSLDSQSPETQSPGGQKPKPPFKNAVWINPNSPRAARFRHHTSDIRYARLVALAASLDSSDPTDAAVAAALSALGDRATEQDAITILNCMENPSNAVLGLRWFQNNVRVKKEVILYNVTLKVLRKSKNWYEVEALWKEMLQRGVKPDNVTFSTVISCARFCNLPEKAVEWFEKMPEFECSPDVVTYSAMIDAYSRSGNTETALGLYDRARKERWRLDPVTFASMIRVYSNSGNFDGALNVYEEMKALGVKPNVAVYNALLDAMGRAGRPWQVKTIFKEMGKKGLAPNRATYAALLRSYCKARYAEDAFSVYRQMKEEGMEITVILYNMLLSMCASIGCVEEAAEIFAEMKGLPDDCKPDIWSYSALITAYSCSGKVPEVEGLLNEMLEAGYEPDIFVLTSIIQCYGKARQTGDVVRTFDKLLKLGITPDDRFCGCLLSVLTQTPTEELGKVIACISRADVKLGSLVSLIVDEGTGSGAVKQEAEQLFNNISNEVRKGYCNCLIDLCVNLNQSDKALVLLDMALQLEIYSDLQSKSPSQWSLHVKSLSRGAALTALHVWMNDLSKALDNGEELPLQLGIHTGHGKHKYSEKGLSSVFESYLKELNAPFHEAPDQVGWFLTTKVAAKSWLESRNSSEPVAA